MRVGMMCGSKWYRWSDWRTYGLFKRYTRDEGGGFRIGPILFWDGS